MKKSSASSVLICCLLLLVSISVAFAQTVKWVHVIEGEYTGNIHVSGVDEESNIMINASYRGSIKHGSLIISSHQSSYSWEPALLKYSPEREALWSKKNRGTTNGIPSVCITDKIGNYYEFSGFENGVFDGTIEQPGGSTAYLTKYSPGGTRLWIKFLSGVKHHQYYSKLHLDINENLLFTVTVDGQLAYENAFVSTEDGKEFLIKVNSDNGNFNGKRKIENYIDFIMDPEGSIYAVGDLSNSKLIKEDKDGINLWEVPIVGNTAGARKIDIDQHGNVYVLGFYIDKVSIAHLELTNPPQALNRYVFLAKFDQSGNLLWLKHAGKYYMGGYHRFLLHPESGLYFIAMNESNTEILDNPVEKGMVICRLSDEGSTVWVKSFPGDYMLMYDIKAYKYKEGLLVSSSLYHTSVDHEIILEEYKVAKGQGDDLGFMFYLEENACPRPPAVQPPLAVCAGKPGAPLIATGDSIRWYRDQDLSDMLAEGSLYEPLLMATTSFYVTQTRNGCESRATKVEVWVNFPPLAPVVNNVVVCGERLQAPLVANGSQIQWYADEELTRKLGEGKQLNITRPEPGFVFVTQKMNGCESPAARVELLNGNTQFDEEQVPNVITPNGDNLNDAFLMPRFSVNTCIGEFRFVKIYNRWGNLVYESSEREFAWNASGCGTGVYYYELIYSNFSYKGTLNVLR